MIAAAFLVLLRPYSIQCALFLLLLLLGTIATIIFFCCWHRKLQKGRHPMKSVFSGRSRSRGETRRRRVLLGRSEVASPTPSVPTPQAKCIYVLNAPWPFALTSILWSLGLDNHGDSEVPEGRIRL